MDQNKIRHYLVQLSSIDENIVKLTGTEPDQLQSSSERGALLAKLAELPPVDMDPNADGDRDRIGIENSVVEDDRERGRFSIARCPSQSSLDESSQRAADAGADAAGDAPHAARLLAGLARLRRDAALCDVRLQAHAEGAPAAGPPLAAHRAVLAAASPYFRAMFTQFDERTRPLVTIRGVEPAALEAIVEYVYSPAALAVSEEGVQALLAAASLLQVGGVRAACCAFLRAALAPDNALGIRAFAELHACAELARAAAAYADEHFVRVLATEEFLALAPDALASLLAGDRLLAPSEEVVLDAALSWVRHSPARRRDHLPALLEHVRLPLVAQDTLVARAAEEPLVSAPVRVKDLLIEALSYHLMRPERRLVAAAGCARARPRAAPQDAAWLLVAGGQAPKAIRDAEALRLDGARWRRAAPLPSRRCRAGLAVLGERAYAVGGFNGTLRVRSVDVYDLARDRWEPGPPLGARRSTLGVAAVAGSLYAVGGFDGAAGLSSCEALAPGAAAWRPVAPMGTRRSSVGVAVLRGRLYAVGGYDGAARACLASVERYEPAADAWAPVADMAARRSGAGVAVAEDALYAVGGHDGPAVRRSTERYRPDADAWEPAPPMHSARRNAAVAAHRGKLYVVGGDDGAANLSSVEVFDPATDSWTLLSTTMSIGRSYAGVAVVERGPPSPPPPDS